MIVVRNRPENWQPWKNGGGLTRVLATYPPGSNDENFLWRLSIAKIDRPGPFSRFSNTCRKLLLLQGRGAVLKFDGHEKTLGQAHEWLEFPGDADLDCGLIQGPCLVLNVMMRPGWDCELRIIQGQDFSHTDVAHRLVVVARGAYRCGSAKGLAADLNVGDAVFINSDIHFLREQEPEEDGALVDVFLNNLASSGSPMARAGMMGQL